MGDSVLFDVAQETLNHRPRSLELVTRHFHCAECSGLFDASILLIHVAQVFRFLFLGQDELGLSQTFILSPVLVEQEHLVLLNNFNFGLLESFTD